MISTSSMSNKKHIEECIRESLEGYFKDLRAALDVVGGGLGHHRGIGPGDLHRDRRGLAGVVRAAAGLEARPELAPRRDHLAHRVAGPEALAQLPERPVGDPCHRCREQPVCQLDVADAHGVAGC